MAGRKKSSRKKSILIYGILLAVTGILFIFISLFPSSMGVAGRFIDEKFLAVSFGKASILAGVYCLCIGLLLLFVQKRFKYIAGLTCLFVPALIVADVLLTASQAADNNSEAESAVPIGHFLRLTISDFIGNIGLIVLIITILLCGLFLLIPKSIISGLFKRFYSNLQRAISTKKVSRQLKSEMSQSKDITRETPPEKRFSSSNVKEVSQGDTLKTKTFPLKLERYDREFTKIPTGLFEEHITFNTALPVGTRRQDIIDAFASFNIEVDIGDIKRGPSFEQYELIPGKSVKTSQIKNCIEDISLKIKQKVNIGKKKGSVLTIEVPLEERQVVPYGFLLEDTSDDTKEIPIAVGVDACFSTFSIDLVELPHLLIAGTTGSGKSIFLKTLIASIMYHLTPNEVRLVLIDPKRVEFGIFSSSLFCACDVITEFEKVPLVFEALILEMEKRYQLLEHAGCSDIRQYNHSVEPQVRQPYIVVVIDEFADLLMQKAEDFEEGMIRLAQKARASGIHLVMATQRPSADVIKGLLKTNIPGRIALSVSSQIDSRIIIDMNGAENLTGKGDLICICPAFREGIRLQGAYISKDEIKKIIAAKS
ncbi:MAG: DNA translocase FtsK [Sedimentisphaerales bacterium]|nr:DNA translocase FtsK [Sedimentisphaerales bacterium]